MGVLSGYFANSVKKVAKQYAGELAGGLINKLPTQARRLASGALKEAMGTQTAVGVDIPLIRASGGVKNDWRCKITWEDNPGGDIFDQLPGKNTVIWPYTPQFQINYQANYESIKTLQTNYASQAYQGSEISNMMITGVFTATTLAEANYLYATIHFLKSATKGFNVEAANNNLTGKPPPVLRLNYLGNGSGIIDMPVVIQSFNMDYPTTVDYVRSEIKDRVGMVPTEANISITLVPVYPRSKMIDAKYSTTAFIKGELLDKGFF